MLIIRGHLWHIFHGEKLTRFLQYIEPKIHTFIFVILSQKKFFSNFPVCPPEVDWNFSIGFNIELDNFGILWIPRLRFYNKYINDHGKTLFSFWQAPTFWKCINFLSKFPISSKKLKISSQTHVTGRVWEWITIFVPLFARYCWGTLNLPTRIHYVYDSKTTVQMLVKLPVKQLYGFGAECRVYQDPSNRSWVD